MADSDRIRPEGSTSTESDMNPRKVPPLSKADPSVDPEWNEHVHEYFNQDAHPGEALPTASHEAKQKPEN